MNTPFYDDDDECSLDDYEFNLPTECPNCGISYDDIDYEYQICHHCHFNANQLNNQSIKQNQDYEK